MRVITGSLKGQTFANVSSLTHPMSEKMLGRLFNVLGDISDLDVLDCYAGTGAVIYEAISRGANTCVAVEHNSKTCKNIKNNIKKFQISSKAEVIKSSVKSYADNSLPNSFDVIICDPPYDDIKEVDIISLEPLLKNSGIFVVSYPPSIELPRFNNLYVVKEKSYGDSKLVFLSQKL